MMIPIFQPPDDRSPNTRQRALKMMLVGMLTAVSIGLLIAFMRGVVPSAVIFGIVGVVVALTVIALVTLVNGSAARQDTEKDKRKRGLEGQDMYTLIDRLVDDLDGDELAYLQKRLDDRTASEKDDLAQSVESLLDRRSQDRRP